MTTEAIKAYKKAYREANKEKRKAWREANREKIRAENLAYRAANKDKIKAHMKVYREANREKIRAHNRAQKKAYRAANKEQYNAHSRIYSKHRMKTDIQYKMRHVLRARLRTALKGQFKAGSAVRDLGCSIEAFKRYIESKFQPGMSWDNYGPYGWHLDHIIPLATFDLTDREQLLSACKYTNYQPMWASENLAKSDNCSPVDRFFLFH